MTQISMTGRSEYRMQGSIPEARWEYIAGDSGIATDFNLVRFMAKAFGYLLLGLLLSMLVQAVMEPRAYSSDARISHWSRSAQVAQPNHAKQNSQDSQNIQGKINGSNNAGAAQSIYVASNSSPTAIRGNSGSTASDTFSGGYSADEADLTGLSESVATSRTGNAGNSSGQKIDSSNIPWRIRFVEAATVSGPNVTLGEIAVPAGQIPAETWRQLSSRTLWPSPTESGRAVNMTRPRLQQAAVEYLGQDLARLCLYPKSIVLQHGGKVLTPAEIQDAVVNGLTPLFGSLPGEVSLQDFRLPVYVFLNHQGQVLELEPPTKLMPGRISLRLNVRELDGTIVKRLTGTVFLDCWVNVPCASAPMNKGEFLDAGHITFVRKNIAQLRENVWDGKGGPWRIVRPITLEQVIYQSDLDHIPMIAKGSTVTLLYEGSSVRLTVTAEALSDGSPGETIPVRNLGSKKQVYATVVDGTTVAVHQGMPQTNSHQERSQLNSLVSNVDNQ